ncbi:MAG: exported protein of unknown function [Nitrospira sp.]|jgi:hypothetical protein|nr:exported protein of unknown function [Nitrospira sp.]
MHTHQTVSIMSLYFVLAIAGGIVLPLTVQAADQKLATIVAPTRTEVVASGAVEDTLTVCMARIPQVSTPGQRLIAEQSCQRDESGRASMQAVPGR